ncbi:alpha-2-macroglobulin family protein, partial [Empedobacter brevis]
GDIVTVRLEISIDRNMQFVHIKDMRASGFEPVNVLSGYKWKGEFGYYESTRDAATNFFSDFMRKGTYVFEYDLKANNAGNFSNGITSMQNMYAPELSAQSEGIRVEIK